MSTRLRGAAVGWGFEAHLKAAGSELLDDNGVLLAEEVNGLEAVHPDAVMVQDNVLLVCCRVHRLGRVLDPYDR